MGIGDKQRMERERRDKYVTAIFSVAHDATDPVGAVLALVDAEIEPLQEQIEEESQRHALLLGRVMLAEALLDALPYEIMKDAETRGDLPMSVAKACADRVRYLVDGYKIERDHEAPEPTYEYGLRHLSGHIEPVASKQYGERLLAVTNQRTGRSPREGQVLVRRVVGEWEDVK